MKKSILYILSVVVSAFVAGVSAHVFLLETIKVETQDSVAKYIQENEKILKGNPGPKGDKGEKGDPGGSIISSEPVPVGTIIASMLNEAEFEHHNGSSWVLADGRDITIEDEYRRITQNRKVPDLRGMFLRGIDPTGKVDPEGKRTPGSEQKDSFKKHTHKVTTKFISEFQNDPPNYDMFGAAGEKWGDYEDHKLEGVQLSNEGGVETRPINVAVYYYIKIN